MRKVITYCTYDLLHQGHINLLKWEKLLDDCLMVESVMAGRVSLIT